MMRIGAVMLYVDDFDTALEFDRDPEGNRPQVYQFAG